MTKYDIGNHDECMQMKWLDFLSSEVQKSLIIRTSFESVSNFKTIIDF